MRTKTFDMLESLKDMGRKKQALVFVCILCVVITACRARVTPSVQVGKELDAIKDPASKVELADVLLTNGKIQDKYAERYRKLSEMLREFEYEIVSEELNEDKTGADVVVSITTYDLGSAYNEAYEQVIKDAANEKIDAETDVDEYVLGMVLDKMTGLSEKKYSAEVTLHCKTNDQGDWITDVNDSAALREALTGNLNAAIDLIK